MKNIEIDKDHDFYRPGKSMERNSRQWYVIDMKTGEQVEPCANEKEANDMARVLNRELKKRLGDSLQQIHDLKFDNDLLKAVNEGAQRCIADLKDKLGAHEPEVILDSKATGMRVLRDGSIEQHDSGHDRWEPVDDVYMDQFKALASAYAELYKTLESKTPPAPEPEEVVATYQVKSYLGIWAVNRRGINLILKTDKDEAETICGMMNLAHRDALGDAAREASQ